jgi:hypothetical protein
MQEAEIAWLRGLLGELDAGTFPDVPVWQHAHDEGLLGPAPEGGEPQTT